MIARVLDNNLLGGYYTEDFLLENNDKEINGQVVSDWVLTEVLPNNLISPIWDGSNWIEGMTAIEVQENAINKAIDNEFQSYLKRKIDGENAYLKLSAEFRLAKQSGQITEETHAYLEELLTPVRNEVMFGQWKKGLSILESIGFLQIGSELYDRLHLQISNYVNENY